jgi:hypothetical protein
MVGVGDRVVSAALDGRGVTVAAAFTVFQLVFPFISSASRSR